MEENESGNSTSEEQSEDEDDISMENEEGNSTDEAESDSE